jgi:dsRNA-specific ribonuclease
MSTNECDEYDTTPTIEGIYLGSRDDDFKSLIIALLNRGNLNDKYMKLLINDDSMKIFGQAFTSETIDGDNNYQVLEQIGDLSGNKFIVSYIYARFPQLECAEGVKLCARLRINYGSKTSFSEFARKLGFWPFISATKDLRQRKMKPLLEDVFEAFIGATETILDSHKRVGVGYAIVYRILASLFDEIDISLKYEDLYDAKTRLKELFDIHESKLGPLVYKESKASNGLTQSTVFRVENGVYKQDASGNVIKTRIIGGNYIKIGEGVAALKSDAQQNAAQASLTTLNSQGYYKAVPNVYKRFDSINNNKIEKIDYTPTYLKRLFGDDLNQLHSTKEKNKYQNKYLSTPIAMYCRQRNKHAVKGCISVGADPNIKDIDGMTSIDLLFIGKIDEETVVSILKSMLKKTETLIIHKPIYDMYYKRYISEYFQTITDKIIICD